jgi:hypothetical protein
LHFTFLSLVFFYWNKREWHKTKNPFKSSHSERVILLKKLRL